MDERDECIETINGHLDCRRMSPETAAEGQLWAMALCTDDAGRVLFDTPTELRYRPYPSFFFAKFLPGLPTGITMVEVLDIIQEYNSGHPPE